MSFEQFAAVSGFVYLLLVLFVPFFYLLFIFLSVKYIKWCWYFGDKSRKSVPCAFPVEPKLGDFKDETRSD